MPLRETRGSAQRAIDDQKNPREGNRREDSFIMPGQPAREVDIEIVPPLRRVPGRQRRQGTDAPVEEQNNPLQDNQHDCRPGHGSDPSGDAGGNDTSDDGDKKQPDQRVKDLDKGKLRFRSHEDSIRAGLRVFGPPYAKGLIGFFDALAEIRCSNLRSRVSGLAALITQNIAGFLYEGGRDKKYSHAAGLPFSRFMNAAGRVTGFFSYEEIPLVGFRFLNTASPAGRIRPARERRATFARLIGLHELPGRRGVKRIEYDPASTERRMPSIHPNRRAWSTDSGHVMPGRPLPTL